MGKRISIFCIVLLSSFCQVLASDTVILGGESIGIVAEYDGILINGFYDIKYEGETYTNASILEVNDMIVEVEGIEINDIEQFKQAIIKNTVNDSVEITYMRNDTLYESNIVCIENKSYACGLYLKESVNGIGTITYYDTENNTYAALAHSISSGNNDLLQQGTIFESSINSITKSNKNEIGSKNGVILYDNEIGHIEKNSMYGIYGEYSGMIDGSEIELATIDDISVGEASLYTVVDNNVITEFSIYIDKIEDDKFVFIVNDETLIEQCGGIIQGMSGSPIVQNNKLVGAVSLVVVNEPTKGYGIYIEDMVESSNNIIQ